VTGQSAEELVTGQSSSECTVSEMLLCLCDGDSSGSQEGNVRCGKPVPRD
jgi:hypothetical protein